jgi:hypothetical protein
MMLHNRESADTLNPIFRRKAINPMVKERPIRRRGLFTSAGVMVLVFLLGGCSVRRQFLQLTIQDVETLKRIYESSSIALENISTNIQVKGGGVIEVDIEGDALPNRGEDVTKLGRSEATPYSAESGQPAEHLWMPILLTKDLPKYFEVVNQSEGPTPQIEAYQLSGGLWCVAEIIEREDSDSRAMSAFLLPDSRTRSRTNHLTMRTTLYSENFVENLPILIPTGQNGSTSSVSVTLPQGSRFGSVAVSGLVKGEGPKNQESQQLTLLPSSISGGAVKAGVTLLPSDVLAWDLSNVKFQLPTIRWPFRNWFLPSAALLVFVSVAFWIRFDRIRPLEREILRLKSKTEPERYEEDHLRYLSYKRSLFKKIFLVIAALCVGAAIWLLGTMAYAQAQQLAGSHPAPRATLCDANIVVSGRDLQSADRDRVNVSVDFFAMTPDKPDAKSQIEIGTTPGFSIDYIPRSGDQKPLTILRQNTSSTNVEVQAKYSSAVRRLGIVGTGDKSFVPAPSYFKSLNKADRAVFSYAIRGSQQFHERGGAGLNWLYLFPFDTVNITVPLLFDRPVLLSGVEFQQQADFVGSPQLALGNHSVGGETIPLVLNDEATKYHMVSRANARMVLEAKTSLVLTASFERRPLQKYGLPVMLLLGAVVVGVLVGFLMTLPDGTAWKILIGALGALGLPAAIWGAVFEHYKDLPSILTGRGISVFELGFAVAALIILGVSLLTKWLLK